MKENFPRLCRGNAATPANNQTKKIPQLDDDAAVWESPPFPKNIFSTERISPDSGLPCRYIFGRSCSSLKKIFCVGNKLDTADVVDARLPVGARKGLKDQTVVSNLSRAFSELQMCVANSHSFSPTQTKISYPKFLIQFPWL